MKTFSILMLALAPMLSAAVARPGMAESSFSFDDMDDLLDKSIDDLKDLPEFKVPSTGMYRLGLTVSAKEINEKPAVEASFRVIECIELAEPTDEPGKLDDKFSIAFFLKDNEGEDSELGFGRLKEFVLPFKAHFNEDNLKTVLQTHLSNEVLITALVKKIGRKPNKKKNETLADVEGKFDARVSNVVVE